MLEYQRHPFTSFPKKALLKNDRKLKLSKNIQETKIGVP